MIEKKYGFFAKEIWSTFLFFDTSLIVQRHSIQVNWINITRSDTFLIRDGKYFFLEPFFFNKKSQKWLRLLKIMHITNKINIYCLRIGIESNRPWESNWLENDYYSLSRECIKRFRTKNQCFLLLLLRFHKNHKIGFRLRTWDADETITNANIINFDMHA